MVIDWNPTEIPCGFERAVFKLDDMNKRDKYEPCCVYVCGDGKPTIKRFNTDGTITTITLINGKWFEAVSIEGNDQWQQ